jgi:hypothetical protein
LISNKDHNYVTCQGCEQQFEESMIKDWDNSLCEECYNEQGINNAESRYDRD